MQILNYLHSVNIYYGDMKPANILVFRNYLLKVDDLGISIKLHPTNADPITKKIFTYKIKGFTTYY